MNETLGEAERDGAINQLTVSGTLLTDVTRSVTSTGKEMLKARLAHVQPGKSGVMTLDITVWGSDRTEEEKRAMLAWHKGDSVVVTGSLSIREWQGRTYVGIVARAID